MISRCPSCAAEVEEDASRCPSCHWDFELRQRVPPDGSTPEEPKPVKKAVETTEENPSPEPSLPPVKAQKEERPRPAAPEAVLPPGEALGSHLKQLPKIGPPPQKFREEPDEQKGFSIPTAKDPRKEMMGPPATEVRVSPAARADAKPEKEKEKDREKEKERQDAADRFKKKGKTAPKVKEPARPGAYRFVFNPKLAAGIVVVVLITVVGIYLGSRPETPGGRGAHAPAFSKGSNTVKVNADKFLGSVQNALTPAEPDRSIRQIQRVVVDPQAGVVRLNEPVAPAPPPAPTPAPAPAPAPAAATSWVLEGEAYDLITLKPVKSAKLAFKSLTGGEQAPLTTDAHGRFKIVVPAAPGGGYELTVAHGDYLEGYIDEMSPPLKEADLDERRLLAASAVRNSRWVVRSGGSTKRDIIMIPKIIPADAQ